MTETEKLDPHFCAQVLEYKDQVIAARMYKDSESMFPVIAKCWDCQTKIKKTAMLEKQVEMIARQTRWDLQRTKPKVVVIQGK